MKVFTANKIGESLARATPVIDSVAGKILVQQVGLIIRAALLRGEAVELPGIGKLRPEECAARKGHNPKTGESIDIPEKIRIRFSADAELEEELNS